MGVELIAFLIIFLLIGACTTGLMITGVIEKKRLRAEEERKALAARREILSLHDKGLHASLKTVKRLPGGK